MIFGEGDFRYEWMENWEAQLGQFQVATVPGICVDQNDRLYILSRNTPPVIEMDINGRCLDHWGDDIYIRAHGVFLTPDGQILSADDGGHVVYCFDRTHNLVRTMGTKGHPSDTGVIGKKWQTIQRAAGPFNCPTNVAQAKNGDIYVSDGYGNARVHVFDPEGKLKFSWGEPGNEPGHFNLPHSLRFDADEILYVCDRQNNRVQLFDKEGHFLDQWCCFQRPADLFVDDKNRLIYVAECKRSSIFDGEPARVTILNKKGTILARVGGSQPYVEAAGSHHTAHGIAVDSEGSLYVAEVGRNYPTGYIGLKKYRRLP